MIQVAANYRRIVDRIHEAAKRSGRPPEAVRIVAVTKTIAAEHIREAAACGITDIGENRLQEALSKQAALLDLPLSWHFIGHIQTNKAARVAENFVCIHSVDRLDLVPILARHKREDPVGVFIEVKLYDEPRKSGVAPDGLAELAAAVRGSGRLHLRGLMTVPPPLDDPEDVRPYFRRLSQMAVSLGLGELSMGMTQDFEVAVEEGATMVRIGTGLFGSRS